MPLSDAWRPRTSFPGTGRPEYGGCGVAYWDRANEKLNPYGTHAVRHAAAQSYLEAVDPSWDAISKAVANPGGGGLTLPAFWAEKKIPMWLRFGAASYVERFFRDPTFDENPWWARDWALRNLRGQGELPPLEKIFAFQLDPGNPGAGEALISQAGLLVSFMLDSGREDVTAAHEAFRSALRSGGDTKVAAEKLQAAIVANARALEAFAFAGLEYEALSAEAAEADSTETFLERFVAAAGKYEGQDEVIPFLSWIVAHAPVTETGDEVVISRKLGPRSTRSFATTSRARGSPPSPPSWAAWPTRSGPSVAAPRSMRSSRRTRTTA